MMRYIFLILIVAGLPSCTKHIVREAVVYQAELDMYTSWATKQAALLKGFVTTHCSCDAVGTFTTLPCRQSADFVLTVEARAAWHREMSLFLAGLVEKRPAETPPPIPASNTLCVLGGEQ